MAYRVVPIPASNDVSKKLQEIIDFETQDGWKYVNHNYHHYLRPGNPGCFGFNAKPDAILHVGLVVFEKD